MKRPLLSATLSLLIFFCATGCAPGIAWELNTYEHVHEQSQRENRVTFVYFRHWALPECTRFEEDVLKSPEVLAASREFNCVPLDFHWDRPLAQGWGVASAPAVVLVAPTDKVLNVLQGKITKEALLDAMAGARQLVRPDPLTVEQ